jgi:hypothetical protein
VLDGKRQRCLFKVVIREAHQLRPANQKECEAKKNPIVPMIILFIELAIFVLILAGMWQVFAKAGQPGWAAIVPIYNIIVLLQIGGKPWWWVLLFLIPVINIVMAVLVGVAIAKSFGKSDAFGVGLGLLGFIFYPILGFGDAQYQGIK